MHPTWPTAPPTLMIQSREVLYRCGLLVRWFIMRVLTTSTGLEATAAQKLATALDLQWEPAVLQHETTPPPPHHSHEVGWQGILQCTVHEEVVLAQVIDRQYHSRHHRCPLHSWANTLCVWGGVDDSDTL